MAEKDLTSAAMMSNLVDAESLNLSGAQETAWIEVIQKMEEVYSDLIQYDIELEDKNTELEEAQQFISSVLSAMTDALIVCDPHGIIQQVNAAALDLTGYHRGELEGRTLEDVVKPLNPVQSEEIEGLSFIEQALANQITGGSRDTDAYFVRKTGQPSEPVSVTCSTRIDHKGHSAGVVLIGRPIGELRRAYEALNEAHADLKRAQQQIVQSEKMASLGRLVAGVAHELNNPISFVYGNIHALDRYRQKLESYLGAMHGGADQAELEALRKSLRIDAMMTDLGPLIDGTTEGAERVRDIVKNLRRLSHHGDADPEVMDLAKVVKTASHWAERGQKNAVQVEMNLQPGLAFEGIAGQIHQVIVNLVTNALAALNDAEILQPKVRVSAKRLMTEDGPLQVVVEDNGPGVPDADRLRVFDPFFTTKPVGQGTGLGLWISYGIVRDHGGNLDVGRSELGGAAFVMTLPATTYPIPETDESDP